MSKLVITPIWKHPKFKAWCTNCGRGPGVIDRDHDYTRPWTCELCLERKTA